MGANDDYVDRRQWLWIMLGLIIVFMRIVFDIRFLYEKVMPKVLYCVDSANAAVHMATDVLGYSAGVAVFMVGAYLILEDRIGDDRINATERWLLIVGGAVGLVSSHIHLTLHTKTDGGAYGQKMKIAQAVLQATIWACVFFYGGLYKEKNVTNMAIAAASLVWVGLLSFWLAENMDWMAQSQEVGTRGVLFTLWGGGTRVLLAISFLLAALAWTHMPAV